MKKSIILVFLLVITTTAVFSQESELMRAGIVEFEEKNFIGIENAGVIIPEILTSHLGNIGSYILSERILLKKTFEEQKLQLSGMIDETQVVEIGKITGLQAVISGTAMKVGSKITISGRVINAETAEIIASGTVEFEDVNKLEENLEDLAYQLSGFSSEEYKKIDLNRQMSKTRYGIRIGGGFGFNDSESTPNTSYTIAPEFFFHSRYVDFEVATMIPPAKQNGIYAIVNYNPFLHLGFGAGYLLLYDGMSEDAADQDEIRQTVTSHNALLGVNYRATNKLRIGLYFGPALSGELDYKNAENDYGTYTIEPQFSIGSCVVFNIEYIFTDNLSLKFAFINTGVEASIDDDQTANLEDQIWHGSGAINLALGYSFSF